MFWTTDKSAQAGFADIAVDQADFLVIQGKTGTQIDGDLGLARTHIQRVEREYLRMDFAICSQEFEVGSDNSECLVDDILAVTFHVYDWMNRMPDSL